MMVSETIEPTRFKKTRRKQIQIGSYKQFSVRLLINSECREDARPDDSEFVAAGKADGTPLFQLLQAQPLSELYS